MEVCEASKDIAEECVEPVNSSPVSTEMTPTQMTSTEMTSTEMTPTKRSHALLSISPRVAGNSPRLLTGSPRVARCIKPSASTAETITNMMSDDGWHSAGNTPGHVANSAGHTPSYAGNGNTPSYVGNTPSYAPDATPTTGGHTPFGDTPVHSDTPLHGFGATPVYQTTPGHDGAAMSDDSSEEGGELEMSHHNPEPPSNIKQDIIAADNIGNTVFSKHWLFTTLMELVQVVEKHSASEDQDACLDLDEEVQDELCKLWDMSMNVDVVSFLLEFNTVELLAAVMAASRSPRATEICTGILGNMCCVEAGAVRVAGHDKLLQLVLLLLHDSDAPSLTEATRLVEASLAHPAAAQRWLAAVHGDYTVRTNVFFILSSSTNTELLHNTALLLDTLLDVDETLCEDWPSEELIIAVSEASKQVGLSPSDTVDTLCHVLQLVSTTETGVATLLAAAPTVCALCLGYLRALCADEIVGVEGREHVLAAIFSVCGTLMPACAHTLLAEDYALVRYLGKVLEVVYPHLHWDQDVRRPTRCRRRTRSVGDLTPTTQGDLRASRERDEGGGGGQCADNAGPGETGAEASASPGEASRDAAARDPVGLRTLYEVMHALTADILAVLAQWTLVENGVTSDTDLPDPPSTLTYLNELCSRERVYCVVWMLRDLAPPRHDARTPPHRDVTQDDVVTTRRDAVTLSEDGLTLCDDAMTLRHDDVTRCDAVTLSEDGHDAITRSKNTAVSRHDVMEICVDGVTPEPDDVVTTTSSDIHGLTSSPKEADSLNNNGGGAAPLFNLSADSDSAHPNEVTVTRGDSVQVSAKHSDVVTCSSTDAAGPPSNTREGELERDNCNVVEPRCDSAPGWKSSSLEILDDLVNYWQLQRLSGIIADALDT